MTSFSSARRNMVDTQIHTNGVVDGDILHIFETVPREEFVPDHLRAAAYHDEDLYINGQRFLMEPFVQARLYQEAHLTKDDMVLDVGCGSGYSSAVLSFLVSTVVSCEDDEILAGQAQKLWDKHEICNVVMHIGALQAGCEDNAPYQHIILNGASAAIPEALIKQLCVGGTLLMILRENPAAMGQALRVQRLDEAGAYSSVALFQAATPYLAGFEPQKQFQF